MADNADNSEQQYQPEQTGMYELEFPAPQLSAADGRGPVMIHALEGFSDAGHAVHLAAEHLKSKLDTELVASFAIDDLLDYRSRRPLMTFKTDHFTDYTPGVGEVQVPGSVSNLLEYRMAQHGHEVVGFSVHVPHYLAQTDFPAAAEALLEQVAKLTSLQVPLRALTDAGAGIRTKID